MKEFINKHPRLYWGIVVTLAILSFAVITCIGFGKLERAEAATQTVTANVSGKMQTFDVYDIRDVDWSEWVSSGSTSKRYIEPDKLAERIVSECSYMIVRPYSTYGFEYYFYKEPIYHTGDISGQEVLTYSRATDYYVQVNFNDGSPKVVTVYGCYDDKTDTSTDWYIFYTSSNTPYLVGSTYDFLDGCTDMDASNVTRNNLIYPKIEVTGYDESVPYVVFDSFTNTNYVHKDWNASITNSEFELKWKFSNPAYVSENPYRLEQVYYVWLPSPEYVWDYYYSYCADYDDGIVVDTKLTEAALTGQISRDVTAWQKKVGTDNTSVLFKYTKKFEYPADMNFSQSVRRRPDYLDVYFDLEGDDDFDFREYYGFDNIAEDVWLEARSLAFGHMYMTRVDNILYECRSDGDYYNGVTTFSFLIDGTAVDSRVDGDALADENLEESIASGVNQSLLDKIGELGGTVNDLQGQLNNINGTLGSYDIEFDGNSLWGAIRSVGAGFVGMTGFLSAFAGVVGGFFSFLPYDMQQIIGYIVIVSLLVIIWRLFKK